MGTASHREQQQDGVTVLEDVPFERYVQLVSHAANRHLRMGYLDGTLEIMSPRLRKHESPSRRINVVITTVADVVGLAYAETGSCPFRRAGAGPRQGTGREPDQSYHFQSVDRFPVNRDPDLDLGDPPPDLWIEVDHRANSRARLPTYARLGISEVWQCRAATGKIPFLRLDGTRSSRIDQSIALPVLIPSHVEEALRHGAGLIESHWVRWLQQWAEQFRPNATA